MKNDYRYTKEGKRRFKHRYIYLFTWKLQNILWLIGIAWHNTYSNECTCDFNCCNNDLGRFKWFNIGKLKYNKNGKTICRFRRS